ncbi:leucyl aminopeptidase [Corynebacterium halotolerans]|uniref:Probable cytosol aminopeptidase n=1 Tax=Corynebacterium halotolerans YIM 70093 = DSM 44683 TaxID=1121362 RepID=M1MZ09_9CORY|nr:leucyl aminopeptidase [Corynebacterium halotolerans]AGF72934.1 multifunctional aminopeptidase A [Corynebacterium halotolerans YIM 70093 = DSM 44683]
MAKPTFQLPARGASPDLELAKKAPKNADVYLVPVFKGEEGLELPASALLDDAALRTVLETLTAVGATGKADEITRVPAPEKVAADSIVAVGLGDSEDVTHETVRRAAGAAARSLTGVGTAVTTVGDFGLGPAVEGVALGAYQFRGIRSEEPTADALPVEKVIFLGDTKAAKDEFVTAQITAESVLLARDLVNTPASHLYPEAYAGILAAAGRDAGLDVEVLDEDALEKEGFGGILAVGRGSARPPRLVRLSWSPRKAKTSVALVGKGITFDTGGISLKPAAKMEDMISDMGGSAAVAATIIAAARLNLPVKVTATLPLAENMPSGTATRPGDVITHYGGLTSEIINTDAEGRLVLADALARASEDDPDYLVETATLTGAQMVALGARTAGVMGTDEFRDRVAGTGRSVGEPAWAMPLLEEQAEELKSPVADIRNSHNSRNAGMLFAGLYLSKFIHEDIEWAHVDIAGPSFNTGGVSGYTVKRATGVPVRTFVTLLRELAEQK